MTDLAKLKTRYDADIVAANVNTGDSDQSVADYYNAPDVTPDAEIRASREQIMEALDIGEFKVLSAATRDAVSLVLMPDSVVIRGSNARAIILDAFPAGTNTRTNLGTLQAQLEASAERTRAERGRLLKRSPELIAADIFEMRVL